MLRPLVEVLEEAQGAAGSRSIDGLILWPEGEWEARLEERTYRPVRISAFANGRQSGRGGILSLLDRLPGRRPARK